MRPVRRYKMQFEPAVPLTLLTIHPILRRAGRNMKFSTIILSAALSLLPFFACGTQLSYDTAYDNPKGKLSSVACSDGSHGFLTRGYTTFDTLPLYPHIGGSDIVKGWNSPNCGSCHQLTYTNGTGAKSSINVLVIDVATEGFNVAQAAMNELTGGYAAEIGIGSVTVKQVKPSACGL
ncbi:Cerato-platanin-domain-containing protein [Collybia nuda]|uniref:Cerato-platanin-domain-containing protein n=1 Tax=Collybia nuda TaxID=64659 RepID=A0A9P6CFV5_9AGAR|nr:Cerato-platanin-domain-containing protein [Collybia nuda]